MPMNNITPGSNIWSMRPLPFGLVINLLTMPKTSLRDLESNYPRSDYRANLIMASTISDGFLELIHFLWSFNFSSSAYMAPYSVIRSTCFWLQGCTGYFRRG